MRGNENVTHRIKRMPRLCIPMKDVASNDMLRSAARQALSAGDLRMGKPPRSYVLGPRTFLAIFCSRTPAWEGGGKDRKKGAGRSLWELKHLSTRGKEIKHRDSPSSGERTGISLNLDIYVRGLQDPNI